MEVRQSLPAGYAPHGTLDLSRQKLLTLGLSGAALLLFVAAGWALLLVLPQLRPDLDGLSVELRGLGDLAGFLLVGTGLLALMILIHEAIHGLLFWGFTGARPQFGISFFYAYAAAPGWYLPRPQYIVVALAPLLLITLVGILLIPLVPSAMLPSLLVVITANIAGSIGDLLVVGWLLAQPTGTLVQDTGAAVTIYRATDWQKPQPAQPSGNSLQSRE